MRNYLRNLWEKAMKDNENNIFFLLERRPECIVLDCGCADGKFTVEVAKKIETKRVFGIEIVEKLANEARERGINVKRADLNGKFHFEDESVDVVVSNQVIKHFYNTTNFIKEIHRVLRKGGYAVISTGNLASWHNIFALILGWQLFSLSNISKDRLGVGNPFSLLRNQKLSLSSMQHIRVFAYRGLREIFEIHGFKVEKILGSGYYPLPGFLAKLDPRHSAFLAIKIRKA